MIKIKFLDVCMLKPGGTHDATYLRKYIFYKKLMENAILQEPRMWNEEET